jgi:hypothetical protein
MSYNRKSAAQAIHTLTTNKNQVSEALEGTEEQAAR